MRLWLNIVPTFWLDKKIHFYRLKYALANFTNERNSIEILHFDNSKCLMAHFSYVAFLLGSQTCTYDCEPPRQQQFFISTQKGLKKKKFLAWAPTTRASLAAILLSSLASPCLCHAIFLPFSLLGSLEGHLLAPARYTQPVRERQKLRLIWSHHSVYFRYIS